MKLLHKLFFAVALLSAAALSYHFLLSEKPVMFLIGDSTMADKTLDDNPERGWGQVFPLFFNDDIIIENHAKNGRSTKSFIGQGLWKKVFDKMKPGDYVFIQFGHNDSKLSDTSRYAEAHTAYKQNLIRFVNDTRSKGAFPVLLTPVNRRKFDKGGSFIDQHGDYPMVVKEVSSELNVPLIDLHAKSLKAFSALGAEATKKLFLQVPPKTYKALPEGKEDNTHFVRDGAKLVAEMVIDGIKELKLPIVKMLKEFPETSNIGKGKLVALDYFYNHEIKNDADGKPFQFHYTWGDKENSGYYILGNIFENMGAGISEMKTAPMKDELDKCSIYIIVDPDIPAENPSPNYISDSSAACIYDWVSGGGVLLLLGNDKGNAEFEHLNRLSGKFGITFNEVSRNKVTDKNFDMGKFDVFPDHPLFKGIKKIYMKEVSTFSLKDPAKAILTQGGDVIIACSQVGKGFVLAVGDPWIYNEYIDNRRLPKDFENFKAAENLVKFLLEKAAVKRNSEII